jgi:hypothetical protein
VVHVLSEAHAVKNTTLARENGADGVFLINHYLDPDELLRAYAAVRTKHPRWWIGLNILGPHPSDVLEMLPDTADGLWTDSVPRQGSSQAGRFEVNMAWKRNTWPGLYFGGVAFKGQPFVLDVKKAASDAVNIMDVITTSGERTGVPPDLKKIQRVKEGAGTHPVAIASGIGVDNVGQFLPYVDCFIVSSSLEREKDHLDRKKMRAFAERLTKANTKQ